MRVLILDDEKLATEKLGEQIRTFCPEIKEIDLAITIPDAIQCINDNLYDILFLDIELPELTGLELCKSLSIEKRPRVVYVSGHSKYAVEAFNTDASFFLQKPVQISELKQAVKKVSETAGDISTKNENLKDIIPIFDGNEYLLLPSDQIIRIQADGAYSKIYCKNHPPKLVSKTIGKFEPLLENKGFVKCHRSHLIQVKCIIKYSKNYGGLLTLINGDEVPISRRMRSRIQSLLEISGNT